MAGASTILNRLVSMSIFPTGKKVTTRLPIYLRLRRGGVNCRRAVRVQDAATGETYHDVALVAEKEIDVQIESLMNGLVKDRRKVGGAILSLEGGDRIFLLYTRVASAIF